MKENWRLATACSYLDGLGFTAFAWEFLRRNPAYRADYQSIRSEDEAALVARRWGCAINPDLRADRTLIAQLQELPLVN
jgi:hypothetical protein